MNSKTLRITVNLITFSAGLYSSIWLLVTYGFSNSSNCFCALLGLLYGLLMVMALRDFSNSKIATDGYQLPAKLGRQLRTAVLVVPLLTNSYVLLFYVVRFGYCLPGGVDRAELFKLAEKAFFGKALCTNESLIHLRPILQDYLREVVTPRVEFQWHPPKETCPREVICSFAVSRDGKISRAKIVKTSGNSAYDEGALEALNVSLPGLPSGSPDRIEVSSFSFRCSKRKLYPWEGPIDSVCNSVDEYLARASYCEEVGQNRDARMYLQCGLQALKSERKLEKGKEELELLILRDLARQSEKLRDYASSCKFYQEAIRLSEVKAPASLPTCLYELADLQYSFGDYKKALVTYARALEIAPQSNFAGWYIRPRMAHCNYALGNYSVAFGEFEKLLEQQSDCVDRDLDYHLSDRRRLSVLMLQHGMEDRAVRMIKRSIQSERAKARKEDCRKICELEVELAYIYGLLKQKAKQEFYLKSALDTASSSLGVLHPETLVMRDHLAEFYWASDSQNKALALFQLQELRPKLDEHRQKIFDEDLSNVLFHKGAFLSRKKLWSQAEKELSKSFAIRQSLPHLRTELTLSTGFLLQEVLQIQNKEADADRLRSFILKHTDMTDTYQVEGVVNAYLAAGDLDKGIGLYELEIERLAKLLGKPRLGQDDMAVEDRIRSILKESFLVCQKYKDPRAERFFRELYARESRLDRNRDTSNFIQFCIRQKRLTEAEYLCHLELNAKNCPHNQSESFKQAHLLSALAHIKYSQGFSKSALYYITRAIATLEPYRFSNEQVILKGLKAQILWKNGDLREAESLLSKLLENDFAEENTYTGHDPAPLFDTYGGDAIGTCSFAEYENSNHERRADPVEFIGTRHYDNEEEPSKLEMVDLMWPSSIQVQTCPRFLRACTLVALSDLNAELKRIDRVLLFSQKALEQVEENLRNPVCFDSSHFEVLIQHLPKSQRSIELINKIQRDRARLD